MHLIFLLTAFVWAGFVLLPTSLTGGTYLFSVGPEVYSLTRIREGGSEQQGRLDGVFLRCERLKGCSWYAGIDYLYATGDINGTTGTGRPLKSEVTDEVFEARVGYALQQRAVRCPFFVPFAGCGYFREINAFSPPSLTICTFIDSFPYATVGFLSGVNFTPLLSMGICFKARFMLSGTSVVTDDPRFEDIYLTMKNETQLRLDLPVTYAPNGTWLGMGCQLTPFYEYRHFGGREGYPFNFKDTKLYLYGARFTLMLCF